MTSNRGTDVIAVIPARGGSKGIPRKNVADLCGKPLVAYSIEVALASRLISRVFVSTDSEEVASISRACGAEVPFLRSADLAHDTASLKDVHRQFLDHLERAEGFIPYALCVLLPTSPFRTPGFVDSLVGRVLSDFDSAVTVKPVDLERHSYFHKREDGYSPGFQKDLLSSGQHLRAYRPYGSLSVHRLNSASGLRRNYFHQINDPVMMIDIDYPEHLELARRVIDNGLFEFH